MKSWEKKYFALCGLVFGIICALLLVLFVFGNDLPNAKDIWLITEVICVLFIFMLLLYFALCGIMLIRNGWNNIKKVDDSVFKEIEKYKRCWGESKEYYIKQIQIINLYYKKDGKIDELIKNNEIERLYARYDFLSIQNSLFDNMTMYFCSLVISVIASFVCQMMECKNLWLTIGWGIVIVVSFFMIILSRYAEKGQAGSYRYMIDEYEKGLLIKKIEDLEKSFTITDEDEKSLELKQIVIKELIHIRQKCVVKAKKEKVEKSIKTVEQLDLCIGDYSNSQKRRIYINKQEGFLLYDKERGKENNYIGELNLKNENYAILYEVLKEHELISYVEE